MAVAGGGGQDLGVGAVRSRWPAGAVILALCGAQLTAGGYSHPAAGRANRGQPVTSVQPPAAGAGLQLQTLHRQKGPRPHAGVQAPWPTDIGIWTARTRARLDGKTGNLSKILTNLHPRAWTGPLLAVESLQLQTCTRCWRLYTVTGCPRLALPAAG